MGLEAKKGAGAMTGGPPRKNSPQASPRTHGRRTSALVVFVCLLSLPVAFLAEPLSRRHGMPILFLGPWAVVLSLGCAAVTRLITRGDRLRGWGCLVVAGVIAGWLYVQGASICVSRPEARSSNCRANIQNIGLGLQIYATAYNEVWPPADRWCDLLLEAGYVEGACMFQCPDGLDSGSDYAFNCALAGRKTNQPPGTVLAFESVNRWNACGGRELLPPKPRHPDGYNFVFVDGRVRAVPAEEVDGLRWVP
jgi:prepilin-type processing-associated H-X9-DG protein